MFFLHKDAKFQGYTPDGMAIYAVDKTAKPEQKEQTK